jgi:hypothetical protein
LSMRKSVFAILTLSILLASILGSSIPLAVHAPRIRVKDGTSLNWAGYAVLTSLTSPQNDAVSDVKGSWTVPSVDCSVTKSAYASFWIGIDGYSSNSVEQIGTDSDCSSGKPTYYAWYEMYPKYPVNLKLKISPGDTISAEVQYLGKSGFKLTITDTKTGTFSTTEKSPSAKRSSAEWIAEAPWSSGVLPLANFGTVTFQSAQATLNGHTGPISDAAWTYDRMDMVSSSGSQKAVTSALTSSGTSFSVKWYAAN